MADTENAEGAHPNHSPDESFTVEGIEVKDSGRIRIPHRLREQSEIGENDVIHVKVVTESDTFDVRDAIIDGYGRFRVPKHKRDLYDVEDGDFVGLLVTTTEMVAES